MSCRSGLLAGAVCRLRNLFGAAFAEGEGLRGGALDCGIRNSDFV